MEKKSGQLFCFRQVYFAKSCQQIWERVNQPFLPWTESSISQYKLHSFNIQKLLKNFQNHLYGYLVITFIVRAVASVWININRVTLQHNKEFVMFIFYFKTVKRAAFWVLREALFTERLKTIGTAIKITRETTNNQ